MSGRAFDLAVQLTPGSTMLTVGPDTGAISTNMTTSVSLNAGSLSSSVGSGSVLNASFSSNAATETATASASIASLSLTPPGLPAISGSLITARSTTNCRAGGTSGAGSVTGTITINGTTYNLASPPNTVIPLGPLGSLGSVTINKQFPITNGLTVEALEVKSVLGLDIVVASASSAVSNCHL